VDLRDIETHRKEAEVIEKALADDPYNLKAQQRLGYLYEFCLYDDARAKSAYLAYLVGKLGFLDAAQAVEHLENKKKTDACQPLDRLDLGHIYAYQNLFDQAALEFTAGTVWVRTPSQNFVFHSIPGSAAHAEMERIVERKEKDLRKVRKFFVLKKSSHKNYRYFFYVSGVHKGMRTGDQIGAHALVKKGEVHSVYDDSTSIMDTLHEEVHLELGRLGRPPNLIEEGAAVYAEQRDFAHICYLKEIKDAPLLGIEYLLDNENFKSVDTYTSYAQAGSLVGFLMETYGLRRFKKIYSLPRETYIKSLQSLLGKSIQEIENEWKARLARVKGKSL
jgi:hypothetical protein